MGKTFNDLKQDVADKTKAVQEDDSIIAELDSTYLSRKGSATKLRADDQAALEQSEADYEKAFENADGLVVEPLGDGSTFNVYLPATDNNGNTVVTVRKGISIMSPVTPEEVVVPPPPPDGVDPPVPIIPEPPTDLTPPN